MRKRAAAVEATRRRIVEATMALHDEQGVRATTWDDIARKAGVGVGTVYRHFPTLDELVPACGAITMPRLALPDDPAAAIGHARGRQRVERMVGEVFGVYERGAVVVESVERERDVHPALAEAYELIESTIGGLLEEGLRPFKPARDLRPLARAMLDVTTWRRLTNGGLSPHDAVQAVTSTLACRLGV